LALLRRRTGVQRGAVTHRGQRRPACPPSPFCSLTSRRPPASPPPASPPAASPPSWPVERLLLAGRSGAGGGQVRADRPGGLRGPRLPAALQQSAEARPTRPHCRPTNLHAQRPCPALWTLPSCTRRSAFSSTAERRRIPPAVLPFLRAQGQNRTDEFAAYGNLAGLTAAAASTGLRSAGPRAVIGSAAVGTAAGILAHVATMKKDD
jgi:hypothetical protein